MLEESKICPKCNRGRYLSTYTKDASREDGLCRICKTCDRARSKRKYKAQRGRRVRIAGKLHINNFDELKMKVCLKCGKKRKNTQFDMTFKMSAGTVLKDHCKLCEKERVKNEKLCEVQGG